MAEITVGTAAIVEAPRALTTIKLRGGRNVCTGNCISNCAGSCGCATPSDVPAEIELWLQYMGFSGSTDTQIVPLDELIEAIYEAADWYKESFRALREAYPQWGLLYVDCPGFREYDARRTLAQINQVLWVAARLRVVSLGNSRTYRNSMHIARW